MKVYNTKEELQGALSVIRDRQESLGFVPTMGALHEGHLALVEQALEENNWVVVSIFVNPTQFDNARDLERYPRTLESDVNLLETVSKKRIIAYAPTVNDIYQGNAKAERFDFDGLENEMEGAFRDGHFDGVGTIIKRLFNIVKPEKAYFGEKDFQQLQIIRKLVEKQKLNVKIVGCKIHRETNGLAMSSRNTRLDIEHKDEAPFIYKTLIEAKEKFGIESANKVTKWVVSQFAKNELLKLEYFTIAEISTLKEVKRKSNKKQYRAFIAVYAGSIRLIDNIALN